MVLLYKICLCSSIVLFGIALISVFVMFVTGLVSCFMKKVQGKLSAKIAVTFFIGCILPWVLWLEIHIIKIFISL